MKVAWETLAAAILVAASILFIGRYQISTVGYQAPGPNMQTVYRLDRWTGKIDMCIGNWASQSTFSIECPGKDPVGQSKN